jgi:redox-sensitive bicupin YhaK (pirin superfamily)
MVIITRETPLGSIKLRRILPAEARASLGPYFTVDHFGPGRLNNAADIDLAPPPGQGFVGLTYLLSGQIVLDGRTGPKQVIQSGAVLISNSERDSNVTLRIPHAATSMSPMFEGIHAWITVPADEPGSAPNIGYYPAENFPRIRLGDASVTAVLGDIYGRTSPVTQHNSTLFLICELPELCEFTPPGNYSELGIYVVSGCIEIEGKYYLEGTMAVTALGWPMKLRAKLSSCFLVIGSQGES